MGRQGLKKLLARLHPYRVHVALLVYTPIVLFADSRISSIWEQAGLGAVTALVLLLCTRLLRPEERWQVWLCVVVATGFEIFGSLIWGVYRYRWHNIPLYVPFGHGLVYFFGLTAAGLPVFRRHGRRAAYVVLGVCAAWAIAGVTVLPPLTHRLDVAGALCLPIFAWCIVFTPRYAMFAAIFVATTDLELAGTMAHDWAWLATAPWDHVPSGNPPSAVAGGYSIIDGSVAIVLSLLIRLGIAPASAGRGSSSLGSSVEGEASLAPTVTTPGGGGC